MQLDPSIDILGVPISRLGMQEAIKFCVDRARRRAGGYVCFANVHSVTEAHEDLGVRRALTDSTLSVADGLPLVWVSRIYRLPITSRVCGPDFMKIFLHQNRDMSYGFIGGAPGQPQELANRFGLKATCYSPPMRKFSKENAQEDWRTFLGIAGAARVPEVIWIGLGAPKQELWMHEISQVAPETLFLGVGAAFDFLTGTKRRAPAWMQSNGLEWLYRLIQEPGRLWKRYFRTNSLFVYYLVQSQLLDRN